MAKGDEIDYISKVVEVEDFSRAQFNDYLMRKPFSDDRCGEYLMDIAQVMNLLPLPPARILDVGVGSGWTSELFAKRGYEVVGLDISPDMIDLAKARQYSGLSFQICDYETGAVPSGFDAAVIYDSLHHSEDTLAVLKNIFGSLKDGGLLITVEPGKGHSTTADSITVMEKYGTTEKDMPFSLQREFMRRAGFGKVNQYLRLTQLPLADVSDQNLAVSQVRNSLSLTYETVTGLTSIVVATKVSDAESTYEVKDEIAAAILSLATAHDDHIKNVKNPSVEILEASENSSGIILDRIANVEHSLRDSRERLDNLSVEVASVSHELRKNTDLLNVAVADLNRDLQNALEAKFAGIEGSINAMCSVHLPDLGRALQAMDAENARNLRRKFRLLAGGGLLVSVLLVGVMALGFHWI